MSQDEISRALTEFFSGHPTRSSEYNQTVSAGSHTAPSSAGGDYSPNNPWDAPGMGASDFV